jgi:hypothetical protein
VRRIAIVLVMGTPAMKLIQLLSMVSIAGAPV